MELRFKEIKATYYVKYNIYKTDHIPCSLIESEAFKQ